jgi:hypothetical protein
MEPTDKKLYDTTFYKYNRNDIKLKSVSTVLAEVMKIVPQINSAVDFGCGVGTWLAGLKIYGVNDICGFDGIWVNKDLLVIPRECFIEVDFDNPVEIKRKFDLAVSIEVAEHLSENSAENFVKTLVYASDIVLFSAAIPYQGGSNHVNEQWPEYWSNIFQRYNFVAVDCLRKKLWLNKDVLEFHRQNILMYVRKEKLVELHISESDICMDYPPMALITPERYLMIIDKHIKYIKLRYIFKEIIIRVIKKTIGERLYEKLRIKILRN